MDILHKHASPFRGTARAFALAGIALALVGCSDGPTAPSTTTTATAQTNPLASYSLLGDVSLVHDPTIIRQGTKYYELSTDPGNQAGQPQVGLLPLLCSPDKVTWTRCGQIFNTPPPAVLAVFPTLTTLWAPDISFFNGLYHVYYTASTFGSNRSLIGLATSPSMDPTDPTYKWTDQGIVFSSQTTDRYNAIDPNVFVDTDTTGAVTHVWLTYGSFFGGIFQRELNPTTGQLSTTNTANVQLATRPGVTGNPIEGSSLVKHDGFYFLFVSFGACCNTPFTTDTYQIAVGRGPTPQGPFVDQAGIPMLQGGGTILLSSSGLYTAPGGEQVYTDSTGGDLIAFHALSNVQNGLDYLFVKSITWPGDWPLINP